MTYRQDTIGAEGLLGEFLQYWGGGQDCGTVLRERSLMGLAVLLFDLKANLKAVQGFCLLTPPLTPPQEAACRSPVFPDHCSKCFVLSSE